VKTSPAQARRFRVSIFHTEAKLKQKAKKFADLKNRFLALAGTSLGWKFRTEDQPDFMRVCEASVVDSESRKREGQFQAKRISEYRVRKTLPVRTNGYPLHGINSVREEADGWSSINLPTFGFEAREW
jgi:hypothetical protein